MCTSTMSDEQFVALQERVRARIPKVCPACGSSRIQPTWLADREWDCADQDCLAVWVEGEN